MDKIIITQELCDQLSKVKLKCVDYHWKTNAPLYQSVLFLLGSKRNIFSKAVRLSKYSDYYSDHGGCLYMPGINRTTMAKAYIELTKADYVPGAFAHITDTSMIDTDKLWSSQMGYFLDIPVIRFSPEPQALQRTQSGNIVWLTLTIR